MLTTLAKFMLGLIVVVAGLPLVVALGILAAVLMKPYSGLCLCLILPVFGATMLLLIFWRNPPTFGIFKADRRHPGWDGSWKEPDN